MQETRSRRIFASCTIYSRKRKTLKVPTAPRRSPRGCGHARRHVTFHAGACKRCVCLFLQPIFHACERHSQIEQCIAELVFFLSRLRRFEMGQVSLGLREHFLRRVLTVCERHREDLTRFARPYGWTRREKSVATYFTKRSLTYGSRTPVCLLRRIPLNQMLRLPMFLPDLF
jgi:hypothetical protein